MIQLEKGGCGKGSYKILFTLKDKEGRFSDFHQTRVSFVVILSFFGLNCAKSPGRSNQVGQGNLSLGAREVGLRASQPRKDEFAI